MECIQVKRYAAIISLIMFYYNFLMLKFIIMNVISLFANVDKVQVI